MKKKKKKLKSKRVPMVIAAIVLMLIFIVGIRIANPFRPVIGFYDIPEISVQAISALARDDKLTGGVKFRIRILDAAKPLQAQLATSPKVNVLFIQDGKAAAEIAGVTIAPSEAIRRLMPQAMRQAGQKDGTVYGLPLQLDHFEVAYHMAAFRQAGIGEPATLAELLSTARKIKKPARWPIVCAGAEDDDVLLLVGALAEALDGLPAWNDLIAQMSDGTDFSGTLAHGAIRKTLDELIRWRSTGLIHPEWFRMTSADVSSFMEADYAGIVFMPLSAHRKIPQATIEKFASIPFPSAKANGARALTAPAMLGMLIGKNKAEKKSEAFLQNLVKADGQKKLTGQTGLAPVNSTAETSDKQAADVRLWVASSQKPLPEIGIAAFGDQESRTRFAYDLRQYIEAGGVGY